MAHMCLPLSFRLLIAAHECPTTLKVYRVSSGNPNHPRFDFRAGSITVALQDYNSCINIQIYYIRVQRKSYNNISLQFSNKFSQTIIITNHIFVIKAVGSKRSTYITSSKELHPAQGCTSTLSLLGLFLRNQHIAEASDSLLMLFTCNKGLTNPEYWGYSTRLNRRKGKDSKDMQGKGNQGEYVARSRILLLKSCTNVDPYF
jgi:hypothetical protein